MSKLQSLTMKQRHTLTFFPMCCLLVALFFSAVALKSILLFVLCCFAVLIGGICSEVHMWKARRVDKSTKPYAVAETVSEVIFIVLCVFDIAWFQWQYLVTGYMNSSEGLKVSVIYLGVFLVIQSISICIQAYCYKKVPWLDDPVAEAAADADDKDAGC